MTEPDNSNKDSLTIEDVFALIRSGNASHEAHDHWKAATTYNQVQRQLQQLTSDEKDIQKLYHAQCVEYLGKARKSLIEALQVDTKNDTQDETQPSRLLESFDEASISERLHLFGSLFAGPVSESMATTTKTETTEQSLEARLMNLNNQLPSSLKTEQERIRDLNRGLRRLGLAGIDDGTSKKTPFGPNSAFNIDVQPPKSEDEQVEDIINMANDEVKLERQTESQHGDKDDEDAVAVDDDDDESNDPGATLLDLAARAASGENVVDSEAAAALRMGEDDSVGSVSDVDDSDVADLTPEQIQNMHEQLVEAQVQLSTLTAMFQTEGDETTEVEFDPFTGKHLLHNVRVSLQKLSDQWKASS